MTSKWSDAASMTVIFDELDRDRNVEMEIFRQRVVHLFSLLHAVAILSLRKNPFEKPSEAGFVMLKLTRTRNPHSNMISNSNTKFIYMKKSTLTPDFYNDPTLKLLY